MFRKISMATYVLLLALVASLLHVNALAGAVQVDTAVASPFPVLVIGRVRSCNASEKSELTMASAVLAVDCGFALHTGSAADRDSINQKPLAGSPAGTAIKLDTQKWMTHMQLQPQIEVKGLDMLTCLYCQVEAAEAVQDPLAVVQPRFAFLLTSAADVNPAKGNPLRRILPQCATAVASCCNNRRWQQGMYAPATSAEQTTRWKPMLVPSLARASIPAYYSALST
jgi:hypothetical protein